MDLLDTNLYAKIGEEGFARLTRAFFQRIPHDPVLGPMYEPDLEGAEERLREFLVFRFGGPDRYLQQRGHPRLRARHLPFAIDAAARDRWVALMEEAMGEAALPAEAVAPLRKFFHEGATFMINRATGGEKVEPPRRQERQGDRDDGVEESRSGGDAGGA